MPTPGMTSPSAHSWLKTRARSSSDRARRAQLGPRDGRVFPSRSRVRRCRMRYRHPDSSVASIGISEGWGVGAVIMFIISGDRRNL